LFLVLDEGFHGFVFLFEEFGHGFHAPFVVAGSPLVEDIAAAGPVHGFGGSLGFAQRGIAGVRRPVEVFLGGVRDKEVVQVVEEQQHEAGDVEGGGDAEKADECGHMPGVDVGNAVVEEGDESPEGEAGDDEKALERPFFEMEQPVLGMDAVAGDEQQQDAQGNGSHDAVVELLLELIQLPRGLDRGLPGDFGLAHLFPSIRLGLASSLLLGDPLLPGLFLAGDLFLALPFLFRQPLLAALLGFALLLFELPLSAGFLAPRCGDNYWNSISISLGGHPISWRWYRVSGRVQLPLLLILLLVNLILLRPLLQLLWSDPILLIPLLGLLWSNLISLLNPLLTPIAAPFGVSRDEDAQENENYGYSIRHAIPLCTVSAFQSFHIRWCGRHVPSCVVLTQKTKMRLSRSHFVGLPVCPGAPAARPTPGAFFRAGMMPPFQNFRCSDTAAVLKTSRSHTQKSPTIGKNSELFAKRSQHIVPIRRFAFADNKGVVASSASKSG